MKQEKSIEELTERYLDLYRYAFSMLKNKADAEDVVQEAIAVTLSYKYLNNPYGYCVRVVKLQCINLLRQKGTMKELSNSMMHNSLEKEEADQKINEVLNSLDKRERLLVEMHDVDGICMREISEKTGIGLSNIKKILTQAHKKMRRWLS